MALTASDLEVDVVARPAWTNAVPLGLVLLVGIVDLVLYDDLAEAAAFLVGAAMMGAGTGALTRQFKGMSVHELMVAMVLPVLFILLFAWLESKKGYFPMAAVLGFVELVYVPITVVALRRVVLGGALRYVFATTVVPVFIASVILTIMFLHGAFPGYSEFADRMVGEDSGGAAIIAVPLLAAALASGWIWYRFLRLLDRAFQGSRRTPPSSPGENRGS